MLIAWARPFVRWEVRPVRCVRASAMLLSGSLPMSSGEMTSVTESEFCFCSA